MQSIHPLRLALALLLASPALAQTVGHPVIDRPNNDSSAGITLIYLGPTQPMPGSTSATTWSFFDDDGNGKKVTPMIFEFSGANQWKVVAIGTTRTSTAAGVQTHAFATQAGITTLSAGKQYTIGFAHRDYTFAAGVATPGTLYTGVVNFTGYNIFTDTWAYVFGTTNIGTLVGTGGLPFNSAGSGGRIYSAAVNFLPPACGATPYCTAKVSSNQCTPSIGSSGAPSFASPAGFSILTTNLEKSVSAINFFSTTGQAFTPFQGGLLCVASPIYRLGGKFTGGAAACTGAVSYTLQDVLDHPTGGPFVAPGKMLNLQTWSRDTGDAFGSNTSNALQVVVCP